LAYAVCSCSSSSLSCVSSSRSIIAAFAKRRDCSSDKSVRFRARIRESSVIGPISSKKADWQ
jgi:hypothetical protein